MNYEEKKRALGLRETALDTGFGADLTGSVVTANHEYEYRRGKEKDYHVLRPPPLNLDLSHLNGPDSKAKAALGRKGGRRKKRA